MAEAGVDISHQVSTHVNVYLEDEFDHVVTVCDHARETCPIIPGASNIIHHSFSDPATFSGTEDEVLSAFRAVRDEIMAFCREYSVLLTKS
jgi:arsenate reductase